MNIFMYINIHKNKICINIYKIYTNKKYEYIKINGPPPPPHLQLGIRNCHKAKKIEQNTFGVISIVFYQKNYKNGPKIVRNN